MNFLTGRGPGLRSFARENTISGTNPCPDRKGRASTPRSRSAASSGRSSDSIPTVRVRLEHRNAFELLVATVLSAQCTDERVNKVTPALFARYPDPRSMAEADLAEVEALVYTDRLLPVKGEEPRRPVQDPRREASRRRSRRPRRPDRVARASAGRRPTSCWAMPSGSPRASWSTPTSSASPSGSA